MRPGNPEGGSRAVGHNYQEAEDCDKGAVRTLRCIDCEPRRQLVGICVSFQGTSHTSL